MQHYCEAALVALQNRASMLKQPSSYPTALINKQSGEQLITGARNTILGEQLQMTNAAIQKENRREAAITKRMRDDIDSVPRSIPFGRWLVGNPNYDSTCRNIRNQANRNIERAKYDLEYSLRKIDESNQLKLGALNSYIADTPSQFNSGSCGTQLAPGDALSYVKKYLNVKPSALPPFPARYLPTSASQISHKGMINLAI